MHVESTLGWISANVEAPSRTRLAALVPACVRKRTDRCFGAGRLMTAPDLSALVTTRRRRCSPGASISAPACCSVQELFYAQ